MKLLLQGTPPNFSVDISPRGCAFTYSMRLPSGAFRTLESVARVIHNTNNATLNLCGIHGKYLWHNTDVKWGIIPSDYLVVEVLYDSLESEEQIFKARHVLKSFMRVKHAEIKADLALVNAYKTRLSEIDLTEEDMSDEYIPDEDWCSDVDEDGVELPL